MPPRNFEDWHQAWCRVFTLVTNVTGVLQSQSVFTCGEDGFVRAWKPVEGGDEDVQNPAGSGKISRPKEKKQKDRFKPY